MSAWDNLYKATMASQMPSDEDQILLAAQGGTPGEASPQPLADVAAYAASKKSPDHSELLKMLGELDSRSNKSLAAQRAGLSSSEEMLKKLMTSNPDAFNRAIRPLAALTDAWTGSKLSAGIDNSSEQTRAAQIMNLQNMIQNQRDKIGDNEQNALKLKIGTMLGLSKDDAKVSPMDLMSERQAFMAHKDVLAKVDKDPQLKQSLSNYKNLDNSFNNIANADLITPEQLEEFQQSVRGALNIKGTGGVNERERTYLKALDIESLKLKELLKSAPQGIRRDHPILQHFNQLVGLEHGNIRKQYDERLGALTAGYESIYESHPKFKHDLENKIKASREQVAHSAALEGSGPEIGTVEDGHRFKGGDPSKPENWEEI